jgi:hypothetical protein
MTVTSEGGHSGRLDGGTVCLFLLLQRFILVSHFAASPICTQKAHRYSASLPQINFVGIQTNDDGARSFNLYTPDSFLPLFRA